MTSQTGRGKTVEFSSSYMGATKQLPMLIAETLALLPDAKIHVETFDFKEDDSGKVLRADMARLDKDLPRRVHFSEIERPDLSVALGVTKDQETAFPGSLAIPPSLRLWVDPLKYEKRPRADEAMKKSLRAQFGISNHRVIVAGSFRPAYELEPICRAARYTIQRHPDTPIKLLLVPRTRDILKQISEYRTMSDLSQEYQMSFALDTDASASTATAVIVNTSGILQELYSIAETTIIGKSIFEGEGQNPVEPAMYGNRLIGGPRVGIGGCNREAFRAFSAAGLLRRVTTQNGLNRVLAQIPDHDRLEAAKSAAAAFIREKEGAAREYARRIKDALYK